MTGRYPTPTAPLLVAHTRPRGTLLRDGMRHKALLLLGWALIAIGVSTCGGGCRPTPDIQATAEATHTTSPAQPTVTPVSLTATHTPTPNEAILRERVEAALRSFRANSANLQAGLDRESATTSKDDDKDAIERYDEAIRLDPEDADAYIKRGNSYYKLTQYKRAIEDYDKALLIDPGNRTATAWRDRVVLILSIIVDQYFNSAYYCADKGDYQKAVEFYNEAIRLNPQDAMAYNNRGWAYNELGQHERALRDFDEAIRLSPDDANAYFNRAYAHAELGQHTQAIEDLNEAIILDPEFAVAYHNRGVAYENLGMLTGAERNFRKAKELGYAP